MAGPQPAPRNLYGAPVLGPTGTHIVYSRSELMVQRSAWLANEGALTHPGFATCEAQSARADWKYFAFGTGIGEGNIALTSIGGAHEIVLACGGMGFSQGRYWMILRRDDATSDYSQSFVSAVASTSYVAWIESTDVDSDSSPEIAVLFSNGLVEIWDQATRTLQTAFSSVPTCNVLKVRDLDSDGQPEVVIASDSNLRIHALDGEVEAWIPNVGGSDIAIGAFDGDPALEIALTDGTVLDGTSYAVQLAWPGGFGSYLEVGDIDGDGRDELIATREWDQALAFDVDAAAVKWSLPLVNSGATHLANLDSDAALELLVGDAQWGSLRAYDTQTLALEGTLPNPGHGTTELAVGDADGDGQLDVVWGTGHTSTGPDHLLAAEWGSKLVEWKSVHLDGPFRGPARGDVDGDGTLETVVVSNRSDAGFGAGRIVLFDATLEVATLSRGVGHQLGWLGTHDVILRNVDADAELEIVVATSTTDRGSIEIYDYHPITGFTLRWEVPEPKPLGPFRGVDVADVDGDLQLEVVGSAGSYVFAYDLASSALEWTSDQVLHLATELAVGQTDPDAACEVIVLGSDGAVRVLDGASGQQEALIVGDFTCLRITPMVVLSDLIRLGDESGFLSTWQLQGSQYQSIGSQQLLSIPIEDLTFGNAESVWVSALGTLSLFYPPYEDPLWISCSDYGSPFGRKTVYGSDGLLTTGANGVVAFRRPGH